MGMPWFKLYDEAQNDPKLESLTDAQFRVWFRLICFANKQTERGTIAGYEDLDLLAVEVARGDTELLRATMTRLAKLRIICWSEADENRTEFINFAKRQARKASDDPTAIKKRVDKHRQAKRNALDASNKEEKRGVTRYNENVTPPEEEEDKERRRRVEESPQTPLTRIMPHQPPNPPQVQQDIQLRDYLLDKAKTLMSKGVLTKAAENTLKGWFTQHKKTLTVEAIDYALTETSLHTGGDALAYFCQVLERQGATGVGKNKGNGSGKQGAVGELPPAGYSFDTYPDGSWKPQHNPDTNEYAYGFDNLDDVMEQDKEERAVILARKQGLKFVDMPNGKRIPTDRKRPNMGAVA